MAKKILWLEDDIAQIDPHLEILKDEGYFAKAVSSVTEAKSLLNSDRYDLFIQDVMIPTKSSEEEKEFPPEETDNGRKLGLKFYQKYKNKLQQDKTKILVLTQRIDWDIREEFEEAGLLPDQLGTKFAFSDVEVFLIKVKELIDS